MWSFQNSQKANAMWDVFTHVGVFILGFGVGWISYGVTKERWG